MFPNISHHGVCAKYILYRISFVVFLTTLFRQVSYLYNKLSKGVSIVSYQLPYTLQLVPLYPITTNSKAA